ncbi:hypothetical protein J2Z21_008954 [Streptomyces griseochromogenes]|uniref:DUF4232 domain-containing protein n=1 Tax=Streptomyces griseochromogenes TaxID=68214 RepID=A0A1B1B0U1_9ACTN|nr:DUF4232 domain-containing protein [Streptomyces griseochromogenes]ANP52456.1 hypothetical protein AVL59_25575 [Streptomyces griseochromogenes]MBP2055937.1 hypothetical protein [Streptomyces griseochromogenes]
MLSLAVLLGTVACGGHDSAANCGTSHLRWRLTRLTDKRPGAPAAMLTARNTGSQACALDGVPELDAQVGKAQGTTSKPKKGKAHRVVLDSGRTIDFPVFYDPHLAPDGYCFITADLDPSLYVTPPHPARHDYGASTQLTDAKGHHLKAQICEDTIQIGPPQPR